MKTIKQIDSDTPMFQPAILIAAIIVAMTVEIVKIAKLAIITFLVAKTSTTKLNVMDMIIETIALENIDFCKNNWAHLS